MGVCLKLINIRIFPLRQLSCMGRQSVNSMILLKNILLIVHTCMILINLRVSPPLQFTFRVRWRHELWSSESQDVLSFSLFLPNSTCLYDLDQFKSVPSTLVYLPGKMEAWTLIKWISRCPLFLSFPP